MRALLCLTLIALLTQACSSQDANNTNPNNTANAGWDLGDSNNTANNSTANNSTTQTVCPAEVPAAMSACPREGLRCEWGDDIRRQCRTQGSCAADGWTITESDCMPAPQAMCPADLMSAQGQACEPKDSYCDFDGQLCHCTDCVLYPVEFCDGNPIWRCDTPNTEAGCPEARPRIGEPCREDDKVCKYGCDFDDARTCDQGVWQPSPGDGCPMSSRMVKQEIRELNPAQRQTLSQETLRLSPLDVPHDPGDLYGYTSQLLLTIQAQQKQIERLEQRLQTLEEKAKPKP